MCEQQNVQPGDVIEFESHEFSLPDALGFVPANLSNFQHELFVQALISKSTSCASIDLVAQGILPFLTISIALFACTDLNDPNANTCAGNLFSAPTKVHFSATEPGSHNVVNIIADQVRLHLSHLTISSPSIPNAESSDAPT